MQDLGRNSGRVEILTTSHRRIENRTDAFFEVRRRTKTRGTENRCHFPQLLHFYVGEISRRNFVDRRLVSWFRHLVAWFVVSSFVGGSQKGGYTKGGLATASG